jgi:alkylation response protein AidB-like acyl-CoA dehydrogenase
MAEPAIAAFEAECARVLARIGIPKDAPALPDAGGETGHVAWAMSFQRELFEAGLAGIMYPVEVGGRGLGAEHQAAFNRAAAPYFFSPVCNVTLAIVGPTLLDLGSPEQQRTYIPRMLAGDDLWVQCLSEPSGGSDLAGARCTARHDGEQYRVSGSKMWTTNAQFADYALVLVRTDWDVPKHAGLSMLIVPLGAPGVTIVPITQVDGRQEFCQEFFDDVEVPRTMLVGEENAGWAVARRLLFHERNMVAGSGFDGGVVEKRNWSPSVEDLLAIVAEQGRADDERALDLVADAITAKCTVEALRTWIPRQMASGRISETGPAIAKLWSSVSNYRRSELALELSGAASVAWEQGSAAGRVAPLWPGARTVTIGGGTNEVMRNQIAERVLGLPKEPGTDAGKPFGASR